MPMNPIIKAEWLKRLRSGDYEQGKCGLRSTDDKFCCLGVLCDIVDPDGWESAGDGRRYTWHGLDQYPKRKTCEEIGLPDYELNHLASKNDSFVTPWTFKEIADYIEHRIP